MSLSRISGRSRILTQLAALICLCIAVGLAWRFWPLEPPLHRWTSPLFDEAGLRVTWLWPDNWDQGRETHGVSLVLDKRGVVGYWFAGAVDGHIYSGAPSDSGKNAFQRFI